MKLRLFPRHEDAYFPLFQAAADTSTAAANVLVDLLTDLAAWARPGQCGRRG